MSSTPRRVLLVDSSSVLHRCYHGYPPRPSSHEGRVIDVAALHGYAEYTRKLYREFEFDQLIHVLDPSGGSVFRLRLYPEYKANRDTTPPLLAAQKLLLPKMLAGFGEHCIVKPGAEADDIIATLSRQTVEAGGIVLIATQDKDLLQLVDEGRVAIVRYEKTSTSYGTANKHVIYHQIQDVVGKIGVRPDQVADLLALMGDAVDNIPGIYNCGPKRACQLLQDYGDVPTLLTQVDKIKGKMGETLRACRDELALYRKLTSVLDQVEGVDLSMFEKRHVPSEEETREATRLIQAPSEWNGRLLDGMEDTGAGQEIEEPGMAARPRP